jgi:O-antigen/teichoic acid export membrane protein
MLPDASDYGIYNMFSLIVGFGTPLAVLGLYDAMFRQYFEKDDQQYRYDVTTTAQRIILVSSITISVILVLFNKSLSLLFFGDSIYKNIVLIAGVGVFLGANQNPIQAPTRMQNERKVFVVSGVASSIVMYGLSLLLIYLGFSYYGLLYSNILMTALMVAFFWVRNKHFFIRGTFNKDIAKVLFKIGLPLLPTFLIYWIYNSIDKIMITNMLGINELGIYSIGAKMAQVSQLIYSGFAGGWQYFAFSTMKDDDQVELNSRVFEYLGAISLLSLVLIYPFIPFIFNYLFVGDYILGYVVAPYLYLSPLLLMLFQVVANQFIVYKKSYLATISLSLGAVITIILNFFFINKFGIEGAAIATLIGYLVTIITVMVISIRYKCMSYSKRSISIIAIIPVYFSVQRILLSDKMIMQLIFMAVSSITILLLYRYDIKHFLGKRAKK